MNQPLPYVFLAAVISAAVGGCAASSPEVAGGPSLTPAQNTPAETYQLTEREQKLNCKELTGAMRVRILQMRSAKTDGTVVAQTIQSGATKIWGGASHGTNATGERARDRAQLEAYNRLLAEKKCKTFDLAAELDAPQSAATKMATPEPRR